MRLLIEPQHPKLSVEAQCEALGLSRSSYYYEPIKESKGTLQLMRRIEELHYEYPAYGYRKIHAHLQREGINLNEKKMERIWSSLGFRSILPRPNLSKPSGLYVRYPYLLNGLWIDKPNVVFSTDITFIPLAKGFIYLITVIDWFSRYTLSWEISNTLSVDFCLVALEKALEKAIPTYFNTDQGSQFTSDAFVSILKKHSIGISFDGVERAIDNVYQERSWWSLKYERLYPGCYESVSEVSKAINEYYRYFNCDRPHQALLYATPHEIYHNIPPKYSKGEYKGFKVKEANK
jgi:putative transposase